MQPFPAAVPVAREDHRPAPVRGPHIPQLFAARGAGDEAVLEERRRAAELRFAVRGADDEPLRHGPYALHLLRGERVIPRHYLKSAGRSARRRAHVDDAAVVRAYRADALEERPLETSRAAERHEDAPQNFIAVRIPGDDPAAGAVLYIDHVGQRRVLEDLNHKSVARFWQVVRRERRGSAVRAAHGNVRADRWSPRAEDAFAGFGVEHYRSAGARRGRNRLLRDDAERAPPALFDGDEHVYRVDRGGADGAGLAPRARGVAWVTRFGRERRDQRDGECFAVRRRHGDFRALLHRYIDFKNFLRFGLRGVRAEKRRDGEKRREREAERFFQFSQIQCNRLLL